MARTLPLALIALLICATAAFAAAKRPDLGMVNVKAAEQAVAGGKLTIRDRLGNAGKATAAPSTVGYYLSVDGRRSKDDIRIGQRAAGRLKAGKAAAGTAVVTVPNAIGLFQVIACADDKARVRESVETNNCRAAVGDVRILAG